TAYEENFSPALQEATRGCKVRRTGRITSFAQLNQRDQVGQPRLLDDAAEPDTGRRARDVRGVGAACDGAAAEHARSAAGAASLEERAAVCLACHGQNGRSLIPETPSIGGRPSLF